MCEEDCVLFEEFLLVCGFGGQEDEVRVICQWEFEGCCDEVGSDVVGNLVVCISLLYLLCEQVWWVVVWLFVYFDEIVMIVKCVEVDGILCVVVFGGVQLVSFGVCLVQILVGEVVFDGVLFYGSMYVIGELLQGFDVFLGVVYWCDVYVVIWCSVEELVNLGV